MGSVSKGDGTVTALDSFGSKSILTVGTTDYEVFRIDRCPVTTSSRSASKCCWRTSCAPRTARTSLVSRSRPRFVGSGRRARYRDPVHAGTCGHAGLHRRALHRGPRHDAGSGRGARGRPNEDQPACTGRARHRPLGHRRPVRHRECARTQRRDRVRAKRRAVPVPAVGPDRVRRLQGRSPRNGNRAPGQHRVPRAGDLHAHGEWCAPGLPRHVCRHRLAHDDGQRSRACSAGVSAVSRPRRRCSASPCRCSSRKWSASSCRVRFPQP